MSSGNDILDMYIYEANSLLEQLETIILDSEKENYFSEEPVNEIFRIMHTIKGSSAMMEFDALSKVAHRIEDLFFIIREKSMDVVPVDSRPELFDLLFKAIDYFRGEVEKVENNQPLDENIDTISSNVNSLIAKIQGEDNSSAEAAPAAAPAAAAPAAAEAPAPVEPEPDKVFTGSKDFPHQLHVSFDEGCGMESLRAFMLVTAIRDFCSENDFTFFPEDVETNSAQSEFIMEHGFMLMFKDAAERDSAIPTVLSAGSVKSYHTSEFTPPPSKEDNEPKVAPEKPSSAKSAPASAKQAANTAAAQAQNAASQQHSKDSLISVSLSKLDQLSAVVGEIVITESMLNSITELNSSSLESFSSAASELRTLTDNLQDVSMSLRMVPISATFQKMNRIVRDMSKKLNRPAQLVLIGENTEVDKTIVDSIGDPLMHMIRNSMDHGIEETQQERIDAGKDPVGKITLSATDTGSEIIIEVSDDGRGVNGDSVLKKAIKNGIASPDVEYSYREALNFLLMPGFSTNTEVTEYSGRGVGLDVVKKGIEELGGSVSLASTPGKGMTTTVKIPLTMAIMSGMQVSVGDSIFTIPINNIRQNFKVSEAEVIHDSVNGEVLKCMDKFYPIVRARDFYQLDKGYTDIGDGIVMWLESSDCSFCLFVDDLIGEQQVVVKQLPGCINSYNIKDYGINGCTLLGDGNISIILDVAKIYNAAHGA